MASVVVVIVQSSQALQPVHHNQPQSGARASARAVSLPASDDMATCGYTVLQLQLKLQLQLQLSRNEIEKELKKETETESKTETETETETSAG